MSEEPAIPEETPAKKPRKTASPRARKATKPKTEETPRESVAPVSEAAAPQEAPVVSEAPAQEPRPQRETSRRESYIVEKPSESESASSDSWPEAETIQGGQQGNSGNGKRKRRRKKKGGQGGGNAPGSVPVVNANGEIHLPPVRISQPPAVLRAAEEARPSSSPPPQQSAQGAPAPQQVSPQAPHAPRFPIDPEDLAKKAWKIFQSEVSEEGLALIGDQDARDLSRKSFRLAELFLEEQARRLR